MKEAYRNLPVWLRDAKRSNYSDEEIDQLIEWFKDLSLEQVFWLKCIYDNQLDVNMRDAGHNYVQ